MNHSTTLSSAPTGCPDWFRGSSLWKSQAVRVLEPVIGGLRAEIYSHDVVVGSCLEAGFKHQGCADTTGER